jgi:betaine-aldehyde dehydrogenase
MLIGGELTDARSGASVQVIHPGDETVIAQAPRGDSGDVDQAVAAAKQAADAWRRTPITKRASALLAIADAIDACGVELAWIDTLDNGSPRQVMQNDYRMAVEHLRYFAGLALQLRGETIPGSSINALDFTLRDPFGVVGRIVPFNHPFMFAASRIAAPLLAGNCVVLKPAEATSLSALRLGELTRELLPPGVLNIVTGPGSVVGARIAVHPDIPRIAFTGSETVGRQIQAAAASAAVKTVTLELGGKNPLIIFADADIEAAVEGALRGMNFTWQGQSCGSTSRLFVHRSVYQRVLAELGRRMDTLKVGSPLLDSTEVGPLVSRAHYEKVAGFVAEGLADPTLKLIAGGQLPDGRGYYVPPTLFASMDGVGSSLFNEEIFGPVLVAAPFDAYDEAIELANALPFGLTASIWTRDLQIALSAARDIETGYLWVNWSSDHIPGTSFGGVKNSGIGREEGISELEGFTQSKNVYIRF